MSVCEICCFLDNNRFGYVALLDSVTNGKHNAVKFFGDNWGTNFRRVSMDFVRSLNTKTYRSSKKFGRLIKSCYPNIAINPIQVSNVVFDIPYIYANNSILAQWSPVFEEDLSPSSLSFLSKDSIVEYNYQQPIFIFMLDFKRHVPKVNSECLLINTFNDMITREVSQALSDKYIEYKAHIENGHWVTDFYKEVPIMGYKMR